MDVALGNSQGGKAALASQAKRRAALGHIELAMTNLEAAAAVGAQDGSTEYALAAASLHKAIRLDAGCKCPDGRAAAEVLHDVRARLDGGLGCPPSSANPAESGYVDCQLMRRQTLTALCTHVLILKHASAALCRIWSRITVSAFSWLSDPSKAGSGGDVVAHSPLLDVAQPCEMTIAPSHSVGGLESGDTVNGTLRLVVGAGGKGTLEFCAAKQARGWGVHILATSGGGGGGVDRSIALSAGE